MEKLEYLDSMQEMLWCHLLRFKKKKKFQLIYTKIQHSSAYMSTSQGIWSIIFDYLEKYIQKKIH